MSLDNEIWKLNYRIYILEMEVSKIKNRQTFVIGGLGMALMLNLLIWLRKA
jgi:hypothetical protein